MQSIQPDFQENEFDPLKRGSLESAFDRRLDKAISRAGNALLALQDQKGYWCFELEADCTIPAEYIFMMHFLGEIDEDLQQKISAYIREHQCDNGGWNLYYGGDFDLSCSVKAYYALKLAGDDPKASHMEKAHKKILAHGGATRTNVFTRYALAMFRQIPWRGVPFLPAEIILLPTWFPFNLSKVSYWSRAVMVPLAILYSLKAKAKNPGNIHIRELFTTPPELEKRYFTVRSRRNRIILTIERASRLLERGIPAWIRRKAIKKAERWVLERLNGEGGLGAIFPAMVNALEALAVLGYPPIHPLRVTAKKAIDNLLVIDQYSAYCQPCVSPVWDTALGALALMDAGRGDAHKSILKALDWLKGQQVLNGNGDWRVKRPHLQGGGWPFQFSNPHYVDLDDTAVVARAMVKADPQRYKNAIDRSVRWIHGMQSKNGGFASFDVDNTCFYLNDIPFADHGALLDPPTSDVSARCAAILSLWGDPSHKTALKSCLNFLNGEQESDGSWFGRWGTNYVYGTWSVLDAMEEAGCKADHPSVQKAARWLKQMQRPDGGWSESCCTYCGAGSLTEDCKSTSFQTAWAILGLLAAGEVHAPEVQQGVEYLLRAQRNDGFWNDKIYTAPGFPRVFYLKYHGYDKYFPLWALARYRKLTRKENV
jgi:squalene-hopene/tetraprenyl-beta-curcumene cyclase